MREWPRPAAGGAEAWPTDLAGGRYSGAQNRTPSPIQPIDDVNWS